MEILGFEPGPPRSFPLYLARVQAGFPSPADDFIDRALDLNEHLVAHPQATFFVRAVGDSMIEAGIHSGDILVVDRALDPHAGDVVIAAVDGELTVKRLALKNGRLFLAPGNPDFAPIEITEDSDLEVWGTVTYVIHKL
ncbi:MAG: LexA family protein [Desulfovibrionaceae bacterium]